MERLLPILGFIATVAAAAAVGDTYRGVTVAPEHRCSRYDPDDYRYPQSVEARLVAQLGAVYGPYTGTCFNGPRETDIEHIVAPSEAHDSGLCRADAATRRAFARDLLNLTLASPDLNRHRKAAKDVAEWTPPMNACWFANRTIEVRRKYGLTIDAAEARAVEAILARCESVEMVIACDGTPSARSTTRPPIPSVQGVDALAPWDDSGNGRITCAEARRHGIAPVPRGHPAYPYMRDADGDGVVCE